MSVIKRAHNDIDISSVLDSMHDIGGNIVININMSLIIK